MGRHADIGNQRRRRPLDPQRWGIATRSAVVSAAVVLLALLLAGAGLVAVLQSSLTSAVDEAAKIRLAEITAALQSEPERDLSDALLATNQRIAAVQIIDGAGNVVRRSSGAPAAAMTSDPKIAVVQADPAELDDTRITMQTLGWRSEGRYLPLKDDLSATAYWYQNEPHLLFAPLQSRDDLEVI